MLAAATATQLLGPLAFRPESRRKLANPRWARQNRHAVSSPKTWSLTACGHDEIRLAAGTGWVEQKWHLGKGLQPWQPCGSVVFLFP